jgi:hypothetical protein
MENELLDELMGRVGESKPKKKRPSRLDQIDVKRKDVDKATGRKASEGTTVISFRVPAHVAEMAEEAARKARIPFSEAKKAMFYHGVEWLANGGQPEMEYDKNVTAVPPSR